MSGRIRRSQTATTAKDPVHLEIVGRGVTPTFLSASSEAFLPRGPRGRETSQPAGWKAGVTDNWMHRLDIANGFAKNLTTDPKEVQPACRCQIPGSGNGVAVGKRGIKHSQKTGGGNSFGSRKRVKRERIACLRFA